MADGQRDSTAAPTRSQRARLTGYGAALGGLLVVSAVVRGVLVLHGGQYFWPDEGRYAHAYHAWDLWQTGQWKAAALLIFGTCDHLGFKFIMLGPAWLHRHWPNNILLPSLFIALFSVANIHWVWRIARRMGGDEREAFWAAAAMAGSTSMAYWARHLTPYDVAMFWALACLYEGLAPLPRVLDSVRVGLLGFAAFVTYLGYWAIVACALVTHVLRAWPDGKDMSKRLGFGLLGSAGSFVLLVAGTRMLGSDLLRSLQGFASAVTQGDFDEGHLVFFDYLWSAERFSALIWAASLVAFLVLARRTDGPARGRGFVWAASIVALTAILIVGANVFHKFVVYGRLVRQVVPFCALLVGWTAARVFHAPGWRWGERFALLALLGAGAFGLAHPLMQDFPKPFIIRAQRVMNDYGRTNARAEARAPSRFRTLYAGFIWPYPAEAPIPPQSKLLLQSPHPMAWRPYLFEGFNHDQRRSVENTDISMKLVRLPDW